MNNLLIFILSFYFCLISVLAYGNFFERFFLEKKNVKDNINIYTGFYGLMFLTLISLITSYFIQHNYYHNVILHGLGFVYFFSSNFKKNKKFYKHIFYITIFCFLVLFISKTHDDFSYYHLPFTKFLTEHNIIFGMGHLNLGYNFLSSLFFLNSTFYLPLIELYSFHFSIIFFLIFFNYFLLKNIFSFKTHEFFKYFYFLTFIFFNLSFNRLAEFGMDKSGQLLIVILIIKLFEIIITTEEKKKLDQIILLLPLFGLCISIKTYFLSYILLSFSIVLLNGKILKNLNYIIFSKSFFFFLLILLSIFSHHFISTGCIISPLPYLCFEDNFKWARSINDVKELSIWLEQWSKAGAGPDFRVDDVSNYIKNFNWVLNWYEKYFLVKFLDQIGILFLSIIFIFLFFKKFIKSNNKIFFKKEFFIFYFILIIIFYIWFTHHPTLRYGGYSIFYLLVAFPFSIILYKLRNKNDYLKKFKFLIIFIILIVNLKNFNRINNEIERSDIYSFKNFPYFSIDKKEFTKKEYETGLTIHTAFPCWATPSPCGSISNFNNLRVYKEKGYNFIQRKK
tara:strand:+ start:319 stop:2010 length:1692 start_codon:yes stop_codon:yes gene_type:complete